MFNFDKEIIKATSDICGVAFAPKAGSAGLFTRGLDELGNRVNVNGPAVVKEMAESNRLTTAKLKNSPVYVTEIFTGANKPEAVVVYDGSCDSLKAFAVADGKCKPLGNAQNALYIGVLTAKMSAKGAYNLRTLGTEATEKLYADAAESALATIYEEEIPETEAEAEALMVQTQTALINNGYEISGDINSGIKGVIEGAKPRVTAIKEGRISAKWADVLAGKYQLKGYDFKAGEDDIPSMEWLAKNYTPTAEFFEALNSLYTRYTSILERINAGETDYFAIVSDDQTNLSFWGSAGAGKTYSVKALAAALHIPFYLMSCSKHTDEEHYEGIHRPNDNGEWDFCDTVFTKWYRDGGLMCLDEWNKQAAGVSDKLASIIEDPWILMVDGHIPTHRNPIAPLISTENVGMAGCQEQSPAMLTRFPENYEFTCMSREVFVSSMVRKGYDEKKAQYVHDALTKITDFITSDESANTDVAMLMSARSCKAALKKMKEGCAAKEALKITFVNLIGKVDPELAEQVEKSVIDVLPNLAV